MVQLQRHAGIAVAYQDAQGQPRNLLAEGDMSELLQHEIDHLDGILAIDHVLDPRTGFRTRQEHLRQTLR
jgi:peptide deformylase